jgi:hypothetical protein
MKLNPDLGLGRDGFSFIRGSAKAQIPFIFLRAGQWMVVGGICAAWSILAGESTPARTSAPNPLAQAIGQPTSNNPLAQGASARVSQRKENPLGRVIRLENEEQARLARAELERQQAAERARLAQAELERQQAAEQARLARLQESNREGAEAEGLQAPSSARLPMPAGSIGSLDTPSGNSVPPANTANQAMQNYNNRQWQKYRDDVRLYNGGATSIRPMPPAGPRR